MLGGRCGGRFAWIVPLAVAAVGYAGPASAQTAPGRPAPATTPTPTTPVLPPGQAPAAATYPTTPAPSPSPPSAPASATPPVGAPAGDVPIPGPPPPGGPPAPASEAPPPPPPLQAPPQATAHDELDPHRTRRDLGWVMIGIGAPAAAVAAVTSFMLLHEKSVRDDECNAQKVCSSNGYDQVTAIDANRTWNTVAWIVAAAGLGGGTILVLTSQKHDAAPATTTGLTVTPAPAGATFGLRSTF